MSQSRAVDQGNQGISQKICMLGAQMERLAETGAWQQVSEILDRRDAMLANVSLIEQPSTYLSARHSTVRVLELAKDAQTDVAEQLSSIQRARKATDSYRDNSC